MFRTVSRSVLGGFLALTSACASQPKAPDLGATTPTFVLERDLIGKAVGRGRVDAISGDREFTVYLDGAWDDATNTFTLVEDFVWDDGEEYRRTWTLTRQANGEWTGGREDTVGLARGYQDGDVFRLQYELRLSNGTVVTLRDVFVRTTDGVVINRATISKFGFRIGRVQLEVRPEQIAMLHAAE